MRTPEGTPAAPSFRVAVRRQEPPDGPYALRFEVRDGKGVLRLARAGVLIDPPARASAEEVGLTISQLRSSRFLHLWDGGRSRLAHSLARLDAAALCGLPLMEWVELESAVEAGASYLILPNFVPAFEEDEPEMVDEEPTSPQRMLEDFRLQVDAAIAGEPSVAEALRAPALREPAVREPPVREPPVREPPVREPAVREPPVRETGAWEPVRREPPPNRVGVARSSAAPEVREGPRYLAAGEDSRTVTAVSDGDGPPPAARRSGPVIGSSGGLNNGDEPTEVPIRALESPDLAPNLAQRSPSGHLGYTAPRSEGDDSASEAGADDLELDPVVAPAELGEVDSPPVMVQAPVEAPPAAIAPAPAGPVGVPSEGPAGLDPTWPGIYLHARSTTIVRYLRRRLVADRLRILELEAALAARSARGRPGSGEGA